MEPYSYKVIGYANSNLSADEIPFAVVLYMPSLKRLSGYVRSEWQVAIGQVVTCDRFMVEGFLEDFQHCSKDSGTSASEFFSCLENLDVGTIRTLSSGQCSEDSIPGDILWGHPVLGMLSGEFARLLDEVTAACSPLEAYRSL